MWFFSPPPPPPPEPKSVFSIWDRVEAVIAVIGLALTFVAGVVYLDRRVVSVEVGVSDLKHSIEQNSYPRKEAELQQQILNGRLESVSDRVEMLEKSPE